MERQGLEPRYNMSVSIPFSPNRREPHGGRRFKYEKTNIIVNAKVINVLLVAKRFALNYAKYYRVGNIAHCIICVQKQNCTPLTTCAKIAIVGTKLHIHQQVCKNLVFL